MRFQAGKFQFEFPRPMIVMGIVNVTPDSFSDGGHFFRTEDAVNHALKLAEEGAEILDIGGESTRPGAIPVAEEEELRRVLPVIERVTGRLNIPISVDTMKPAVARAALAAGASIINDVGASRDDSEMGRLAAESGAGYVAMHMQGTPATMQVRPHYENVVGEVDAFFFERLRQLKTFGLKEDQIVLDIGIGFGKTIAHNLRLLAALPRFQSRGRPLLLGVSRKGFIGQVTGAAVTDRLPGSLACASWAASSGVSIVRVHDVAATVQAVRMVEAILAHSG